MVVPVTSGLVIHLDADAIVGLSNGDPITTWDDESGSGNDAARQGESGVTYQTGVSPTGKPSVRLDGSTGWLRCSPDSSYRVSRPTSFIVCRSHLTSDFVSFMGVPHAVSSHSSPFWRYYMGHNGTGEAATRWEGTDFGGGGDLTDLDVVSVWRQFDRRMFRDGTHLTGSTGVTTISYPNASGFHIGANGAGAELLDGDVFEILVYNRDLTSQEIEDVETYLNEKWLEGTAAEPPWTLTVNTQGEGSVAKDPDEEEYDDETQVELTATPDSGWTFDSWSGDLTGDTNPDTVVMDADKNVTANFIEDEIPSGLRKVRWNNEWRVISI